VRSPEFFYNGTWYRNELTARWAIFLDGIGVGYRYESQGIEHEGTEYTWPDFWLPRLECWIRIEQRKPDGLSHAEANRLAVATGRPVYVFWGVIGLPTDDTSSAYAYRPAFDRKTEFVGVDFDEMYWWCQCPYCQQMGIEYQGRTARLRCRCVRLRKPTDDKTYNFDSTRLLIAYDTARRAKLDRYRMHDED
jgi:hypothetical protein